MFSGTVKLADLDDYIMPSQDCVILSKGKSVKIGASDSDSKVLNIKKPSLFKKVEGSEKATVNLYDCLACSGCVTSSEVILMQEHGIENLMENISKTKATVLFIAPQSRVSLAKKLGLSEFVLMNKLTTFLKPRGVTRVFDLQFFNSLAIGLTAKELEEKRLTGVGTLLCSECPGWICYLEKVLGDDIVPYSSKVKPPQLIAGEMTKKILEQKIGIPFKDVTVAVVQPCYDKKLETFRPESFIDGNKVVDIVLATREIDSLIQENKEEFNQALEDSSVLFDYYSFYEDILKKEQIEFSLLNQIGQKNLQEEEYKFKVGSSTEDGSSNNYLNQILLQRCQELSDDHQLIDEASLNQKVKKNNDFIEVSATIQIKGISTTIKSARVYGFKNIQNLVRSIKTKRCKYDYVEIMACPSGCLNGGGQITYPDKRPKEVFQDLNAMFHDNKIVEYWFSNGLIASIVSSVVSSTNPFFNRPRVEYQIKAIKKSENPASIKW